MFIGELVVGIIEGVAALVQLLVESLGFAAHYLSDKRKNDDNHFSWRRLFVAFLPFVAVLSVIVGLLVYWEFRTHRRVAQVTLTKQHVQQLAARLSEERDDTGRLVPADQEQLGIDAWNRPIQVRYEQQPFHDIVTVWSNGRDGEAHTRDDIEASRAVWLPKEVGRAAVNRIGNAIWNRPKPGEDQLPEEAD